MKSTFCAILLSCLVATSAHAEDAAGLARPDASATSAGPDGAATAARPDASTTSAGPDASTTSARPDGATSPSQAEAPIRGSLTVPVAIEPTEASLDHSAGQLWHRATMKLIGSLCPACLMAMEDKLKKMPGVTFAKVTRPDSVEPGTPRPHNASLVVIYDANAGRFERLVELIKKELYRPTDVKDSELDATHK